MFHLIPVSMAEEAATATEIATETDAAVAAVQQPGWFQTAFKKFAEFPGWGWAVVGLLLALGLALLFGGKNSQRKWSTRMVSTGAICMALSSVLSMIRLFKMPLGGSITPGAMLPLLLFAYIYGARPGVILGALFGVLKFLLDGGEFAWAGLLPNLLDYPIAYALLGLCGLFKPEKASQKTLMLGVIVGCAGRFIASFLSGWIFYGSYAPEGWSPLWYAISYNGTYMGVNCIICILLASLVGLRLLRELQKNERR